MADAAGDIYFGSPVTHNTYLQVNYSSLEFKATTKYLPNSQLKRKVVMLTLFTLNSLSTLIGESAETNKSILLAVQLYAPIVVQSLFDIVRDAAISSRHVQLWEEHQY